MSGNQDQVEFWNGRMGQEWAALQARMDGYLSAIQDALMPFAAPGRGEAVLDIGCGTGTTSLALADAVGPQGRVTGIDISKPMLELARRRGQGRANLAFLQADASQAAFQPDHALLFSRFGVMFFDDPAAAFANLRKAARPGGRLAFACWRTPPENPWASAPIAAAKPFLPETPPPDPLAPGPFAFADTARIGAVLGEAAFQDIRIQKFDAVMDMGRSLDDAAESHLRLGPLAMIAPTLEDAVRTKVKTAVKEALGRFVLPDGSIAPPLACWLVAARV